MKKILKLFKFEFISNLDRWKYPLNFFQIRNIPLIIGSRDLNLFHHGLKVGINNHIEV